MPDAHTGRKTWEGYYLDGQSAVRQRAVVSLLPGGLLFSTADGAAHSWPYVSLRQTPSRRADDSVQLEWGGATPELLVVPDLAFLRALQHMAPPGTVRPRRPRRQWWRAGLAAVGVTGIAVALYLWGIPALSVLVARRIPVVWEERLGREVVAHLAPVEQQCTDAERLRLLHELVATLTAAVPAQPYTLRVVVLDDPGVNAFAAPGGYIVLFRGLLDLTRSAEELAGVLAHEVQHILQRHTVRLLLQHVSTGLLLAALTGDVSGVVALGLQGARRLGSLQHSRRHEGEADAAGLRLLVAAGIDPAGMVTMFGRLQEHAQHAPGFLQYLSTHPRTAQRLATLETLAAQAPGPFVQLLPHYDWQDMRRMCIADSP